MTLEEIEAWHERILSRPYITSLEVKVCGMLFHQARKGDWTLDVPKMARTLTASKTLTKNAVDRLHELGLFRKVYGGKFALQFTDDYDF